MLLNKVNEELEKVIAYIKEHESAWNDTRNLKLYDVAFYDEENNFIKEHNSMISNILNKCNKLLDETENRYIKTLYKEEVK